MTVADPAPCQPPAPGRRLPPGPWRLLVPLLGVLLLAVGCRAELTVEVAVERDGSGALALTLAVDEQLDADAAAAGIDPLAELLDAARAARAAGWTAEETARADGGRQVRLRADFADPAEFTQLAGELTDAWAAPEATLLRDLDLVLEADEVRLVGLASLEPGEAVDELAGAELFAPGGPVDEVLRYEVVAHMPGPVRESTGTVEDDRTVRWTVPAGERVQLVAVSERPWGWVRWALGLALGVAVVAALALLARRRRALGQPLR